MPHHLIDPAHPHTRTVLQVIAYAATAALVIGAIVLGLSIYELSEATRQTQITNSEKAEADRERAKQTAETAENAARAAARIEDCTTPGRPCFVESQERLRATVGSINDYALAAAVCADAPGAQTIEQLERCILEEITAQQPQPQENR